jgi:hypothetical protein
MKTQDKRFFSFFKGNPEFAIEFTARRLLCLAAGQFSSYCDAPATD